jgi:PAS domain S-box-containing protein
MRSALDEEHRRIDVLHSHGVIGQRAGSDPDFDRLTRLLARICETPIAVVSFIDGEREHFVSVHGADWTSVDRSCSFGLQAIAQPELLVVEDAGTDPRVADHPQVRGDAGLRFYAGMPLLTVEGVALGTLAVFDRLPRRLDALQVEALQTLAAQVMAGLAVRRRLRILEDVLSQRERGPTQLGDSEARWRHLFAASATGIASAGADGRFASANPAFCALVGRSEEELRGFDVLAFTHPDDQAPCRQELIRLAQGEIDSFSIEKRYLRPDGRPVWARATVSMTRPPPLAGIEQDVQYIAVVNDIDAHKAAQLRLQQSHLLIGLAGRMAGLGGWAIDVASDPSQPVVHWSDELRTILDCAPDHAPQLDTGLSWYAPASREALGSAIDDCVAHGTSFDLELDLITLRQRSLSVRVIGEAVRDASGRVARVQGALLDVTERKRAERTLRLSEERFRNVARATADTIWDWDLGTDAMWWGDGMQTLFGYAPDELEPGSQSWTARIHPDDRQRVHDSIHGVIDGGGELWSAEYRFMRRDGSFATVLDRGFVIHDAAGSALRMVGGMTDLTDRRAAEDRLRQQAALLDESQDSIIVRDLDERVQYWNRGAERMFGWSAQEAVGRSLSELQMVNASGTGAARTALMTTGKVAATFVQRHKDGSPVSVEGRWTLVRDAQGEPTAVFGVGTDVTARLELEAQLQQARRLEAVGQLTGGVAHDFNNLLTVILGNADLLAEQLADQPLLLPLAEMTRTAAERGAELTQRLLAFARRQALQPLAVDAHQLMAAMDALLRRTLPENIELELVRGAGLWSALVDPVQLESAVLNLVLNARDAMAQGGKITLETANASIDQEYADRHADVLPGQYVLLSVSDTGDGMTPAQLARAFEPFFTTKGVGKGSGLGLSMVYGFVKQSRGHVKLYSEPGHGTTARLYLPRAEGPPEVVAAPVTADRDFRGTATVLVVEDDPLVRRHARDVLIGLGYQVTVADNGVAALAIVEQRGDIDLLFTDVVMPGGINGRELADAALTLRPALKVLYTSGYTENAIVHHGRLDRGVQLLPKPYRSVDLARKVHAVLNRDRTP